MAHHVDRRRLKRDARPLRNPPKKSKRYRYHVRIQKSYARRGLDENGELKD